VVPLDVFCQEQIWYPQRKTRCEKAVKIGVALHEFRIAKDVIVVTPDEFEWRKDIVGTIEWPAVREGQVLYARK